MRISALIPAALAASTALATLAAGPALATSCAEEISTLERRLDSAGAEKVTGKEPPGGPTSSHSDKALAQPPGGKPSDPSVKPSASGVQEARDLVQKAKAEEKAGNAEGCRNTIMKAKEKAGALP
ncbi:hypothetical protein [Methylobacterium oxalidis]|uniref:Uncharacterized protein n=1 Tax=Methylobacterium oxalidis TaxID=944322 RepID=A0A512J4F6_9HYPH|nr:hypothetical protein [Methylobacterium oxalidis]GEP04877.1 hypothetical protein MOX02_29150 [Methylobacterium oxalidis]GJE30164.1 hypothetical protein LDDCCGHA_0327 [Methylobacterium oxalidis]GLS67008.1 hypothetical protein GCM10007888_53910 [Methylobacterium oxalidis]